MFRKKKSDNIFRNTVDDECRHLNNKCLQPCICDRDKEKNIIKFFNSDDVYKWESNVYVSYLDKNIFPLVTPKEKQLTYIVKDMVSLRTYLESGRPNMSYTLNELFSYIRTFSSYKFLHGNLHIDNIFLSPKTFGKRANFFVIDYANSYVLKRHSCPSYKRTSFIGEFESKIKHSNIIFWDFVTVYVSLKCYFKDFPQHVLLLENIVSTYVTPEKLQELLKQCESSCINESEHRHMRFQ